MGCNDIYNIQTRVGIPNIIDTNNSPFKTGYITEVKDNYTNMAYNIAPKKDNSINNIIYSSNPIEYNNNSHYTTSTTTVTYTTKVLKYNVNEVNSIYKDATIKDNAIGVNSSAKPIEFNNNPCTTTVTTTILRPFTTTSVTKPNVNSINPSIKIFPKKKKLLM